MRLNAYAYHRSRVFDVITGEEVPYVTWIDDEAGEYEVLLMRDGKPYYDPAADDVAREVRKGRLRVERLEAR